MAGDRLARRRKKLLLIGVGSGAFVVIAAVLVGFWVWRTIEEVPDRLFREVIVDETPPAPSDTATDQGTYAEWTTEAAMAMAKHVDEMYRKVHEANAVLDQTKASVELLKSLAEPDPFRQRSDKKEPDLDSIAEPEPYESQYDQFYEECMADVRKQVPSDGATRDAVWKAAQAWADTKQGPVEQQLDTQLKEQLGL